MTTLEIITQINADKIRGKKEPSYALLWEIYCQAARHYAIGAKEIVNAELEELVKANIITIGDTINDKYIKVL